MEEVQHIGSPVNSLTRIQKAKICSSLLHRIRMIQGKTNLNLAEPHFVDSEKYERPSNKPITNFKEDNSENSMEAECQSLDDKFKHGGDAATGTAKKDRRPRRRRERRLKPLPEGKPEEIAADKGKRLPKARNLAQDIVHFYEYGETVDNSSSVKLSQIFGDGKNEGDVGSSNSFCYSQSKETIDVAGDNAKIDRQKAGARKRDENTLRKRRKSRRTEKDVRAGEEGSEISVVSDVSMRSSTVSAKSVRRRKKASQIAQAQGPSPATGADEPEAKTARTPNEAIACIFRKPKPSLQSDSSLATSVSLRSEESSRNTSMASMCSRNTMEPVVVANKINDIVTTAITRLNTAKKGVQEVIRKTVSSYGDSSKLKAAIQSSRESFQHAILKKVEEEQVLAGNLYSTIRPADVFQASRPSPLEYTVGAPIWAPEDTNGENNRPERRGEDGAADDKNDDAQAQPPKEDQRKKVGCERKPSQQNSGDAQPPKEKKHRPKKAKSKDKDKENLPDDPEDIKAQKKPSDLPVLGESNREQRVRPHRRNPKRRKTASKQSVHFDDTNELYSVSEIRGPSRSSSVSSRRGILKGSKTSMTSAISKIEEQLKKGKEQLKQKLMVNAKANASRPKSPKKKYSIELGHEDRADENPASECTSELDSASKQRSTSAKSSRRKLLKSARNKSASCVNAVSNSNAESLKEEAEKTDQVAERKKVTRKSKPRECGERAKAQDADEPAAPEWDKAKHEKAKNMIVSKVDEQVNVKKERIQSAIKQIFAILNTTKEDDETPAMKKQRVHETIQHIISDINKPLPIQEEMPQRAAPKEPRAKDGEKVEAAKEPTTTGRTIKRSNEACIQVSNNANKTLSNLNEQMSHTLKESIAHLNDICMRVRSCLTDLEDDERDYKKNKLPRSKGSYSNMSADENSSALNVNSTDMSMVSLQTNVTMNDSEHMRYVQMDEQQYMPNMASELKIINEPIDATSIDQLIQAISLVNGDIDISDMPQEVLSSQAQSTHRHRDRPHTPVVPGTPTEVSLMTNPHITEFNYAQDGQTPMAYPAPGPENSAAPETSIGNERDEQDKKDKRKKKKKKRTKKTRSKELKNRSSSKLMIKDSKHKKPSVVSVDLDHGMLDGKVPIWLRKPASVMNEIQLTVKKQATKNQYREFLRALKNMSKQQKSVTTVVPDITTDTSKSDKSPTYTHYAAALRAQKQGSSKTKDVPYQMEFKKTKPCTECQQNKCTCGLTVEAIKRPISMSSRQRLQWIKTRSHMAHRGIQAYDILDEITLKDLEPLQSEYPRKDNFSAPDGDSKKVESTLLYQLLYNQDPKVLETLLSSAYFSESTTRQLLTSEIKESPLSPPCSASAENNEYTSPKSVSTAYRMYEKFEFDKDIRQSAGNSHQIQADDATATKAKVKPKPIHPSTKKFDDSSFTIPPALKAKIEETVQSHYERDPKTSKRKFCRIKIRPNGTGEHTSHKKTKDEVTKKKSSISDVQSFHKKGKKASSISRHQLKAKLKPYIVDPNLKMKNIFTAMPALVEQTKEEKKIVKEVRNKLKRYMVDPNFQLKKMFTVMPVLIQSDKKPRTIKINTERDMFSDLKVERKNADAISKMTKREVIQKLKPYIFMDLPPVTMTVMPASVGHNHQRTDTGHHHPRHEQTGKQAGQKKTTFPKDHGDNCFSGKKLCKKCMQMRSKNNDDFIVVSRMEPTCNDKPGPEDRYSWTNKYRPTPAEHLVSFIVKGGKNASKGCNTPEVRSNLATKNFALRKVPRNSSKLIPSLMTARELNKSATNTRRKLNEVKRIAENSKELFGQDIDRIIDMIEFKIVDILSNPKNQHAEAFNEIEEEIRSILETITSLRERTDKNSSDSSGMATSTNGLFGGDREADNNLRSKTSSNLTDSENSSSLRSNTEINIIKDFKAVKEVKEERKNRHQCRPPAVARAAVTKEASRIASVVTNVINKNFSKRDIGKYLQLQPDYKEKGKMTVRDQLNRKKSVHLEQMGDSDNRRKERRFSDILRDFNFGEPQLKFKERLLDECIKEEESTNEEENAKDDIDCIKEGDECIKEEDECIKEEDKCIKEKEECAKEQEDECIKEEDEEGIKEEESIKEEEEDKEIEEKSNTEDTKEFNLADIDHNIDKVIGDLDAIIKENKVEARASPEREPAPSEAHVERSAQKVDSIVKHTTEISKTGKLSQSSSSFDGANIMSTFSKHVDAVIQKITKSKEQLPDTPKEFPGDQLNANKLHSKKSDEYLTPFMRAVKNYRRKEGTENFMDFLEKLSFLSQDNLSMCVYKNTLLNNATVQNTTQVMEVAKIYHTAVKDCSNATSRCSTAEEFYETNDEETFYEPCRKPKMTMVNANSGSDMTIIKAKTKNRKMQTMPTLEEFDLNVDDQVVVRVVRDEVVQTEVEYEKTEHKEKHRQADKLAKEDEVHKETQVLTYEKETMAIEKIDRKTQIPNDFNHICFIPVQNTDTQVTDDLKRMYSTSIESQVTSELQIHCSKHSFGTSTPSLQYVPERLTVSASTATRPSQSNCLDLPQVSSDLLVVAFNRSDEFLTPIEPPAYDGEAFMQYNSSSDIDNVLEKGTAAYGALDKNTYATSRLEAFTETTRGNIFAKAKMSTQSTSMTMVPYTSVERIVSSNTLEQYPTAKSEGSLGDCGPNSQDLIQNARNLIERYKNKLSRNMFTETDEKKLDVDIARLKANVSKKRDIISIYDCKNNSSCTFQSNDMSDVSGSANFEHMKKPSGEYISPDMSANSMFSSTEQLESQNSGSDRISDESFGISDSVSRCYSYSKGDSRNFITSRIDGAKAASDSIIKKDNHKYLLTSVYGILFTVMFLGLNMQYAC